jgi:hypothetical protein
MQDVMKEETLYDIFLICNKINLLNKTVEKYILKSRKPYEQGDILKCKISPMYDNGMILNSTRKLHTIQFRILLHSNVLPKHQEIKYIPQSYNLMHFTRLRNLVTQFIYIYIYML